MKNNNLVIFDSITFYIMLNDISKIYGYILSYSHGYIYIYTRRSTIS